MARTGTWFEERRGRLTAWRLLAVLMAAALLMAACGSDDEEGSGPTTSSGGGSSEALLGEKTTATGTPVKIGMVSNDKNPYTDVSIESPVAEATVKWLNEYRNGAGGHPIELEICIDNADPGKATDCANQLIGDGVAAVIMGSQSVLQNVWEPLHAAKIPVFIYGASNEAVSRDTASTFVLNTGASSLIGLPAGVAKETKAKTVSVVVIDVPAATSIYKSSGPELFEKEGLELDLLPIAAGTADMTPQMQRLTSNNPDGVVHVIGNDAFCISAFNGLRTAGFTGGITTIPQCLTDATRKAVPASFLKGMKIAATAPISDPTDPSIKQYNAVLDKYATKDVDRTDIGGISVFNIVAAFGVAMADLEGEVTPASVIAAAKAMEWSEVPGMGGQHMRCNGKAVPATPAACQRSVLVATLDDEGNASSYQKVSDTEF